jgi:hypothetical protein
VGVTVGVAVGTTVGALVAAACSHTHGLATLQALSFHLPLLYTSVQSSLFW